MGDLVAHVSIGVIKTLVLVHDILTYPIYSILRILTRETNKKSQAKIVPSSDGVCYRSTRSISEVEVEIRRNNVDTFTKCIEFSFKKYGNKNGFGVRKIINESNIPQADGRLFKQYELGDYSWITYSEANEITTHFGRGLRSLGLQPKERIGIYAETRLEWTLSAIGALKQNITICTFYATLGEEALLHGFKETEISVLLMSHDLFPRVKTILSQCPSIKTIIYFPDQINKTDTSGFEKYSIFTFNEIVNKGKDFEGKDSPPSPDDIAFIMYTSGSTGMPKGALLSQTNFLSALLTYGDLYFPQSTDVYLDYLPLAHIFGIMGECVAINCGTPMGYSSPLTMTDLSPKVKKGCRGDVSVLRPTIFYVVPMILDRLQKGILATVNSKGPFIRALLTFGMEYKLKWYSNGWSTPICDWFILSKFKAIFGGRLRYIMSAGAPLSPSTQTFFRAILGCTITQVYALTETTALALMTNADDMGVNRAGSPMTGSDAKLINWEEGNYYTTDKPNPRGELVIGGDHICLGYFKNPEKSKETFYDMDGISWMLTGDIAEVHPDGCFTIIDRKKEHVKLQTGEYVSISYVESELKRCPLVDNLCLYGESTQSNMVVIISPFENGLRKLAELMGKNKEASFEQLCNDKDIIKEVLKQVVALGKEGKLNKFELPTAAFLTADPWTADSGLVTAALKTRRIPMQAKYRKELDRLYGK